MNKEKLDYTAIACKGLNAVLKAMENDSLTSMVNNETLTSTVVSGCLDELKDTKDDAFVWMRTTLERVAAKHCEAFYAQVGIVMPIRFVVLVK